MEKFFNEHHPVDGGNWRASTAAASKIYLAV
jgi:hypothetical protein